MKKTKFLTVILEKLFSCCDTDVYSSPGLDVGGLRGGQYFLGIYGQFT